MGNQAFAMQNFRGPLISALVARQIEVFAFAPDYSSADKAAITALGATPVDYPLRRANISPLHDLSSLRELTTLLRSIGPDVTLSFSTKPVVFGTLAAWLAGVPFRYALIEGLGHAFMDTDGLKARLLRRLVSLLYRASLARATRTLFLNDDDRREFVEARLVDVDRTTMIGAIGVDLDEWRLAPFVTDPLTFVFVGRLLREKGIVEFIDAARNVKMSHPGTRFIVLGAPDTNPSSITSPKAQSWVDEGLIEWPGQVEVGPWLAKSSVFVLPSYREGVPRSTQEAMAMGRPVITTDAPGCRETVLAEVNGLLVPPGDAQALAVAMRRFIDDISLVEAMGTASRRLAEERFDFKAAVRRILAAIDL